jgi:hypothetical protein
VKHLGKQLLGRLIRAQESNVKVDVMEADWEDWM